MILIRDTREQTGYLFAFIEPRPIVEVKKLDTGDYSIKGMENLITVERKSLSDLYQTLGKGRKRFKKELERMNKIKHSFLIIEASLHTILREPPARSAMDPKKVFRSLLAFAMDYNVSIWPCENRGMAEKTCFIILDRFWRKHG